VGINFPKNGPLTKIAKWITPKTRPYSLGVAPLELTIKDKSLIAYIQKGFVQTYSYLASMG